MVIALALSACGGDGGGRVDAALARLAALQDVVDVRPTPEAIYEAGTLGQDLEGGNQVRTGSPGFAEVAYRDGSLARLDAATTLTVTELATAPTSPDVQVDLDAGRVWNRVRDITESDGRYEVDAPVGIAAVRGTAFDVDCRAAEDTGCVFTVVEGEVALTNAAGDDLVLTPIQQAPVAPDGTFGAVTEFTLAELLASDPWFALNLGLDAQRGFAALLAPGGAAPAVDDTGAPIDPDGFDGDAAVREAALEVEPSGEVRQRVVVGGPTEVSLRWSFCDGLSCGTSENAECVTNKYIPSYAGAFVRDLSIGALPGFRLVEAVLQVGDSPLGAGSIVRVTPDGVVGDAGAFASAPSITEDGLRLTLQQGAVTETLRFLPNFPDRACGIGQEERDAILAEHGDTMTVPGAFVRADLVWEPLEDGAVAALAGQQQVLGISEGERTLNLPELAAPGAVVLDDPEPYRPDEGPWADLLVPVRLAVPDVPTGGEPAAEATAGPTEPAPTEPPAPESFLTGQPAPASVPFAEVGTVPTAFAIAFSRLGFGADPGAVGATLLSRGAWRPGVGVDLAAVGVVGADPVDVTGSVFPAEAQTDPATPVLVSLTTANGLLDTLEDGLGVPVLGLAAHAGTQTAVVALSYDASTDALTVLHPSEGELVVPFDAVLDRLQLAYVVSTPAAPSSARLA